MFLRKVFLLFLLASIAGSGPAFTAEPPSRLLAMAEKLAGLEKFSVNMLITYDVVQASGQVIEFGETREVLISRPNHLRIDARQSDGDKGGLIFDGETITQFNLGENVYTQIDQPGDADGAIRYAVSQLGVRVPLARMLVTSFPQQMRKLAESAELVELNSLGEVSTEHFAGRSNDLDYQIWLREDNLPARIVLTYKNSPTSRSGPSWRWPTRSPLADLERPML